MVTIENRVYYKAQEYCCTAEADRSFGGIFRDFCDEGRQLMRDGEMGNCCPNQRASVFKAINVRQWLTASIYGYIAPPLPYASVRLRKYVPSRGIEIRSTESEVSASSFTAMTCPCSSYKVSKESSGDP